MEQQNNHQELQNVAGSQLQSACPNCGYCPHCGRGRQTLPYYPVYPMPSYPWWQSPTITWPQITYTTGAMSGAGMGNTTFIQGQ